MRYPVRFLLTLGVVLWSGARAPSQMWSATQTSWSNFPIGDWFIDSNWSNGIPGDGFHASQSAFITNDGTCLLNHLDAINQPAVALDVSVGFIRNTSGTLLVTRSGAASPAILHAQSLSIGVGGGPAAGTGATGNVTVSSGASIVLFDPFFGIGIADVGVGSLGTGSLTVTDPGSSVQATVMSVGEDTSTGTFNIQNGAQVSFAAMTLAGTQLNAHVASGSSGTVSVTGSGSRLTIGSAGNFEIGSKGTGSLSISSGAVVTSDFTANLATFSGSQGTVTVTGAGSTWSNTGNIFVGGRDGANGGVGTLQIFSGGLVTASAVRNFSNSLVNVDNGSSSVPGLVVSGGFTAPSSSGTTGDLVVGNTTGGRMEIRSGGRVSNLRGYIGQNSGADGAVLVTGAGSRWDCSGSIWSGNSGVGSLEILDGAVVTTAGNGYLGFSVNTSGFIRVSGAGSSLSYAANLYVGGNAAAAGGSGELQIMDGGTVSATQAKLYPGAYLVLGASPTLNAALTVDGGVLQIAANNTLANNFTVASGGVIVRSSTNTAIFSGQISGPGSLNKVFGGFITPNPGTLVLTGNSTYTGATLVGQGKLQVDGSITSDVTVSGGATLAGNGAVGSVTVNSGGIIAPGASPGILTVNGNYTQLSGAILNIQLGGNTPGAGGYDQLVVTGTASLNGILNLTLVDGFRPAPGDTFQIISSAAEVGNFAAINPIGFTVASSIGGSGVSLTLLSIDPLLRVLDVAGSGSDIVITYDATAGKTYRLERKLSLTDPSWETIVDQIAAVTGPTQIMDPGVLALDQAFYQVRLLP